MRYYYTAMDSTIRFNLWSLITLDIRRSIDSRYKS